MSYPLPRFNRAHRSPSGASTWWAVASIAALMITDDRGFAISGASIFVFAEDRRRWTLPDSRYVRSVVSAPDGRFTIPGLPAGRYYAAALPAVVEGKINEPASLEQIESRATKFTLGDSEHRSLTLRFE